MKRLDPERTLSPVTIQSMLDHVAVPLSAEVDDAALRRLALGVADAETRLACARGILASADVRARLAHIRSGIRQDLGTADDAFIAEGLDKARRVDRTLAEGRWAEGSASLRWDLPDLRAAWTLADTRGASETVSTFVELLASALMEMGEWDAFGDLASAGYRAAESLGRPKLRSRLLSYEGVVASRRGDSSRAKALWSERAAFNREIGNPVAEADALIDLAGQAYSDGDFEGWRAAAQAAEPIVAASGRADFAATLLTMYSVESLRLGQAEEAAQYAEQALTTLTGVVGIDTGLFVRIGAIQALAKSGRVERATAEVADILEVCTENGRAVHAAIVLTEIAALVESRLPHLAGRCLVVARGIHREIGTRHVAASDVRVSAFIQEHPSVGAEPGFFEAGRLPWVHSAKAILRTLRGFHETSNALR